MLTMLATWIAYRVLGRERTKAILVTFLTSRPIAPIFRRYLVLKEQHKLEQRFGRHFKAMAALKLPAPPTFPSRLPSPRR